ncbi:hypothetical protein WP50_16910 [Lactiplantibacillus plantarum]|nr:hypothetical protein WP50_16910 [Lactiplantibacillus plantarum]
MIAENIDQAFYLLLGASLSLIFNHSLLINYTNIALNASDNLIGKLINNSLNYQNDHYLSIKSASTSNYKLVNNHCGLTS